MTAIRHAEPLLKFDANSGIAYGFAIVCKTVIDGKPVEYFDLQGHHIPESVMVDAAATFIAKSAEQRVGKVQHLGPKVADILFAFPLTEEIAKSMNITSDRYGLMIGFRATSAEAKADLMAGKYGGFSIGGDGILEEVAS